MEEVLGEEVEVEEFEDEDEGYAYHRLLMKSIPVSSEQLSKAMPVVEVAGLKEFFSLVTRKDLLVYYDTANQRFLAPYHGVLHSCRRQRGETP